MEKLSEVFYMGRRRIQGTMCIRVCPVVDGSPDVANATMFARPKLKLMDGMCVGWIHAMDCTITDKEVSGITFGSQKPIRPCNDEELVEECLLLDRAAMDEENIIKKAKQQNLTAHIDNLVRPIRNAMAKTNATGKAAILALVIQRLTK